MGIYVKFYHDHSPNMVMSRNPGCKYENFYFSQNSILNFGKSCQIWGKLAQEQHSYRQEAKLGTENTPPPPVVIGLNHGISPLSSKITNKTSLLVEDLTVSRKALEMDQN